MGTEDIFKDLSTPDWAILLCRCLLEHRERIERRLGDGRCADFGKAIAGWRDQHLNTGQQPLANEAVDRAARVLYGICETHGVLQFLTDQGFLGPGATRVRGGEPPRPGPIRTKGSVVRPRRSDVRSQMQAVAEMFSTG